MATKLTKKQQGELTEKLAGIIQRNNALQLRLSADRSVNELNINQISAELNRIHDRAIGKELPTVVTIPVNQSGSGTPSPDNIRPITGYEIDGIGTVYGGDLNIEIGVLTVTYGGVDLGTLAWTYLGSEAYPRFYTASLDNTARMPKPVQTNAETANIYCTQYPANSVNAQYIGQAEYSIAINTAGRIYVRDAAYTDSAAFKAALTGVILVYELATPETYTLTSQQMLQLLDQL